MLLLWCWSEVLVSSLDVAGEQESYGVALPDMLSGVGEVMELLEVGSASVEDQQEEDEGKRTLDQGVLVGVRGI